MTAFSFQILQLFLVKIHMCESYVTTCLQSSADKTKECHFKTNNFKIILAPHTYFMAGVTIQDQQ